MNSDLKEIQNIAILGSTGSIGTQTLDVIAEHPQRYRVMALTARSRWETLASQARKWLPEVVVIADERHLGKLREALADLPVKVYAGDEAVADAAELPGVDLVVTALVGYSGLIPTIRAIRAGKRIALANKETLVAGGELVTALKRSHGVEILPVDSEHSAIFQCIHGENPEQVAKIILTASGGPFRTFSRRRLETVTVADALAHPNWAMGAKVTIDSASMMNKGFEMIEARWLFDVLPENIEITVHPQSIVHSMVQFVDGSIKAQLGPTDMRFPISYALTYPERLSTPREPLHPEQYRELTFEAPDREKFPSLDLAFRAIEQGGNIPCVLNAANEIAVAAFLESRIPFTAIPKIVEESMATVSFLPDATLDCIIDTNREARRIASSLITKYQNS